MNRRDFLKAVLGTSGLIAVWPAVSGRQITKPETNSQCLIVKKPEGVLVNDVHTELNPTIVDRIVYPNSLNTIQETIRSARRDGKVICVAGARHAMGAQQFSTHGVLIDMTAMSRVLNFNPDEGTIEVEAGIQWPQVIGYLLKAQEGHPKRWGIAQKQTADWLSMGGSLGSNVHGQGLQMRPFIQDVESFVLIDSHGKEHRCSRHENTQLFRLAIGGYGLFGIIYSVTLRLVTRKKVERVVEIISVEHLMKAYETRVADGFLYGTFIYSANLESDDFLRKGIFVCYRPVDTTKPVSDYPNQPTNDEWIHLRYLAHADKEQYFQKVSSHYLSTSGQLYWSDTHQMGMYIKGYHHQLNRMLGTPHASDIPTEIFIPRESIVDIVDEMREDFRRNRVDLIFGDIGVIQQDDEGFLAYARKPWARVSFHTHAVHSSQGIEHSRQALRRLIDMAVRRGGSYYLTNHKFATPEQVKACYPQFPEFIRLKKKYDPEERFQSDWYHRYKEVFADL
ncbi:MAG TPA: FAD-binding oxidoreductase [Thermodesulfobacteriota bacterium]|nr:FAD-binding oxidoreductase [Thermodesulfobacteriota bacterium]